MTIQLTTLGELVGKKLITSIGPTYDVGVKRVVSEREFQTNKYLVGVSVCSL